MKRVIFKKEEEVINVSDLYNRPLSFVVAIVNNAIEGVWVNGEDSAALFQHGIGLRDSGVESFIKECRLKDSHAQFFLLEAQDFLNK